MSLLEAAGLTAGYERDFEVLRGVSLRVEEGELVAVVGPNGSGKSTLVRALCRSLPLWKGKVLLEGSDIWKLSARDAARRIAVVPQDLYTPFEMTATEIVLLGRHPHVDRMYLEKASDRELALAALEAANALELADRPITRLSGGERQRVMIAKALAQEPRLLLLDEPTAHLDMANQAEVLSRVRQMAQDRQMGVAAVLHDLNLAAAWCDRVVVIGGGRVAAEGSPADVVTEQTVARVWEARVWVKKHPATGRPFVLPMPPLYEQEEESAEPGALVHVICGGGSGGPIMQALMRAGFRLTCGVLNVGDSDEEICRAMNVPHVAEAPFCAVSAEREQANLKLALEADVVVLCDFCIGPGNLANLRTALAAAKAGKDVVIERREGGEDYTDGEGTALLEQIMQAAGPAVESAGPAARVREAMGLRH